MSSLFAMTPILPPPEGYACTVKIVQTPTNKLAGLDGNPRQGDIDAVADSLKAYGFRYPIVVRDGQVLAGNTRLAAAKQLGMKTVPTVSADDLTPEQARGFALADNRTHDVGAYNLEALAGMLAEFDDPAAIPGYDDDYLDALQAGLITSPTGARNASPTDWATENTDPADPGRKMMGDAYADEPEEFDHVPTSVECPKCGYRWGR